MKNLRSTQKVARPSPRRDSGIMARFMTVLVVPLLILFWRQPCGAEDIKASAALKVRATLIELPRSRACAVAGKVLTVMARYRVVRVLSGSATEDQFLVAHRCPEYSRGSTRYGLGTATPLRVGDVHVMSLVPRPDGAYTPLRTDPGPRAPRVVVLVSGGGGTNHKLTFDTESLSVGRAPDADVRLVDRAVAPRHLTVQLTGEKLTVTPTASLGRVLLNGRPLKQAAAITFADHIQLGSYTLCLALFLDPPEQS